MLERIKLLMENRDLTLSQFADKIQIQRSSLSHVMNGRNKPSLDFIIKILSNFPEVNTDWLLFGKGSMDNLPNLFSTSEDEQEHEDVNHYISEIQELKEQNEALRELNEEKQAELEDALVKSEALETNMDLLQKRNNDLELKLESLEKNSSEEKLNESIEKVDEDVQESKSEPNHKQIKQILLVYDDGNLEAYDHKNNL